MCVSLLLIECTDCPFGVTGCDVKLYLLLVLPPNADICYITFNVYTWLFHLNHSNEYDDPHAI